MRGKQYQVLEIEGKTFETFQAAVRRFDPTLETKDIQDLWFQGYTPREAYEELRLEREDQGGHYA